MARGDTSLGRPRPSFGESWVWENLRLPFPDYRRTSRADIIIYNQGVNLINLWQLTYVSVRWKMDITLITSQQHTTLMSVWECKKTFFESKPMKWLHDSMNTTWRQSQQFSIFTRVAAVFSQESVVKPAKNRDVKTHPQPSDGQRRGAVGALIPGGF